MKLSEGQTITHLANDDCDILPKVMHLTLKKQLGKGSFGSVWCAKDLETSNVYAIKFVSQNEFFRLLNSYCKDSSLRLN